MQEKKDLPTFLRLLILTLITALAWVFFTIYRSFVKEPSPAVPADVILPLNPKLDNETMDQMQIKNYLDQIPEPVINVLPQESEVATEEAELEQNPN